MSKLEQQKILTKLDFLYQAYRDTTGLQIYMKEHGILTKGIKNHLDEIEHLITWNHKRLSK